MPPEHFATFRFSTATLPVRERIPFWREVIGRKFCHVDIEPLPGVPFESEVTLRALPGLGMMDCISSPARQQRTREFVADGDDAIFLPINLIGGPTFSQRGHEVSLGVGEATIVLQAEPAVMIHSQGHGTSLAIPRAALLPLVHNIDDAAMRVIPSDNESLRLLTGYLKLAHERLPFMTPELRHRVVTHVHDLVAMAIGATRDGAAVAAERGVRAARLAAIKAEVVARLDRRDLSVAAIAAHQHVTPRYVQLLFESEGITFSQFVLEQRLARAHQMLTSSRHAGWTISAIALAAGFGDLSHFNRSFRRRYGATPSDVKFAGPGHQSSTE
jgi:AraC-like DNA-binding protein